MVTITNIAKQNLVIDTSALIEYKDVIERLSDKYNIIISIVSIEELDNLKTNKNETIAKKARRAIRSIENNKNIITFVQDRVLHSAFKGFNAVDNVFNHNDDIIVSCAVFNNALLLTDDLNLKIKANILKVGTIDFNNIEQVYKGYVKFDFTTEEFNSFWSKRKDYFNDFYCNEYIIINDVSSNKQVEYRFDGVDLVPLKLPSSKIIKGENVLQRFALDMLNNKDIPICAVLGKVGSGKTYLSTRMALHAVQSGKQGKILTVREPVGEGHQIGYLKGDFEDKTKEFFEPIVQCLDGGVYELQRRIDNGEFKMQVPYFLKGTTYNSTVIVVDEAEDLSEKQIKLIGTRLGEQSRIFFSGDFGQALFDSSTSNPLVMMCEELKGNPKFACIYLDEDVRSEASKIFADLYKK